MDLRLTPAPSLLRVVLLILLSRLRVDHSLRADPNLRVLRVPTLRDRPSLPIRMILTARLPIGVSSRATTRRAEAQRIRSCGPCSVTETVRRLLSKTGYLAAVISWLGMALIKATRGYLNLILTVLKALAAAALAAARLAAEGLVVALVVVAEVVISADRAEAAMVRGAESTVCTTYRAGLNTSNG